MNLFSKIISKKKSPIIYSHKTLLTLHVVNQIRDKNKIWSYSLYFCHKVELKKISEEGYCTMTENFHGMISCILI